MVTDLFKISLIFSLLSGFFGFMRAYWWRRSAIRLYSSPEIYGLLASIRSFVLFWGCVFILNLTGASIYLSFIEHTYSLGVIVGAWNLWWQWYVHPETRVYLVMERYVLGLLKLFTGFLLSLVGVLCCVLITESIYFFKKVSFVDFLLGIRWSPIVTQTGHCFFFGVLPLITGTGLIVCISLCIAVPCGLLSAIYLSEYASKRARYFLKPFLEMLAGIPSVVYGFFAATFVAPKINQIGEAFGLHIVLESALSAGLVMGIMVWPLVLSLSDDILQAVPKNLREGSFALGATPSETIRHVILPAAFPGLVGAFLLAVSRSIGETMLVVIAAGMTAHLTLNPFHAVTTITVQIVSLLTADQELDSPRTFAAFALGLLLFIVTLLLNKASLDIVRRYRKVQNG